MTVYLVNAPSGRKPRTRKARKRTTTKRRTSAMATPRRNAKGRFTQGGGTTRRRATTRRTTARKATARRRSYRSNPPRARNIMGRIQGGLTDGLQVLLGEAAARMIPTLFRLPTTGPVGIGVQLASAVALGMVAERVVSKDAARMMVAGGVSAPLQSLVIQYNVPFLAPALQPGTVAGYPQGGRLLGYPRQPSRLAGYPQGGGALQVAPFVSTNGAGTGSGSF